MIKNILGFLITIVVVVGAGYFLYSPVKNIIHQNLNTRVFPCRNPITYRIGIFDGQFGISEKEFIASIERAVNIWEKPVEKDLFIYDPEGTLVINLIYDSRQQATDRLKSLGIVIYDDKGTYDALKAKYDNLQTQYKIQKSEYDNLVNSFNAQKSAYEIEASRWNKKGGAPPDIYAQLDQERLSLNAQTEKINQLQTSINNLAEDINALASVLNRLIYELNLSVNNYNSIGQETSGEFEEGLYKSSLAGQEINIYQFDDREKLIRVLTHELGHALGLDHMDNPTAIMYRLNEGGANVLSADDLDALKTRCGVGQ